MKEYILCKNIEEFKKAQEYFIYRGCSFGYTWWNKVSIDDKYIELFTKWKNISVIIDDLNMWIAEEGKQYMSLKNYTQRNIFWEIIEKKKWRQFSITLTIN
jgi:hypothetical protein